MRKTFIMAASVILLNQAISVVAAKGDDSGLNPKIDSQESASRSNTNSAPWENVSVPPLSNAYVSALRNTGIGWLDNSIGAADLSAHRGLGSVASPAPRRTLITACP